MKFAPVFVMLLAGWAGRLPAQCPDGTPPPCRGVARPAAPVTVAVLPFDNISRDTADAYLAQGITEEITNRLGLVERLTVTSAAVMRHYRGDEDPRRVAASLRVGHLVAGTVRRERARLRISVELIRARDGVALWNRSFDRPDTTLLDIQEAIALAVATSITGRLLPNERTALQVTRRASAAYDHYLHGMYEVGRRTTPALQRAIQEFEAAIRIDSTYGDAIASLSQATYLLATLYYKSSIGTPRESLQARSYALARLALARDSSSSRAWGVASVLERDNARQRAMLEHALTLDPRNPDALIGLANLQARVGDDAARERLLRRAVDADPGRYTTLLVLGMHLAYQGLDRYPEASRWLDSAIALHPEASYFYSDRARVRVVLGDTAGARADARETARLGNDTAAAVILGLIDVRGGRLDAARAMADSLAALLPAVCRFNFVCLEVASLYAALGDADRTVAILERWPREFLYDLLYWCRLAEFRAVRETERFRSFMASRGPPR